MQEKLSDYIDKLYLLESRIKLNANAPVLECFDLNTSDIIAIQNAGKQIAKFVGLTNLTFVISTVRQKEGVGGHIELNDNPNDGVFIEVCDSMLKSKDAVLATLAHEICHKFLHINNINCGHGLQHTYENEILTDITAVYLGMGKLMLNGCEWSSVRTERHGDTTQRITETLKTGYLKIDQFATVYNIVCTIRNVELKLRKSGLKPDAQYAYDSQRNALKKTIMGLSNPDDFRKKLFDSFTNVKEQIQTRLAEIERDVIYIKKALIENIEEYLNIKHKQVTNLSSELENLFKNTEGNDKLLSLNLIKAKQNIDTSIKELEDKESDLSKHAKNVRSVALYMLSKIPQFKKPIDDMFKTVRCWNDQTILKVPTGKTKVKIKCPKCGYQFVVNSNPTLKKANFLLNLFSKKDKALQGDIVRKN